MIASRGSCRRRRAGATLVAALVAMLTLQPVSASLETAIGLAIEASRPYLKEGFTVREDQAGGDLGVGDRRAVRFQLFKGNEYWFWTAVDVANAKVHVRVVGADGIPLESERREGGRVTGIRVVPPTTGSYYVVIEVLDSPEERTGWAVIYGFR